jgi:FAD synthetase
MPYSQGEQPRKYKHVMCFGTFDIFHPGHMYYLHQASELAQRMTIIVARDARVLLFKGQSPLHDETSRLKNIETEFPKASVRLGDLNDIFKPIEEIHPDVLAFGYDQYTPEDELRVRFPNIDIVRLESHAPHKFKSSILRKEYEQ